MAGGNLESNGFWKRLTERVRPWLDHLDPALALVGGAAAGIAGIFGWISGDALPAATLLVLSVVGFALYRERSLRDDARERLESLSESVSRANQGIDSLQSGDPFRILTSEAVWDISEADGSFAILTLRRRIRFHQNNVFAMYDFSGGDGRPEDERYFPGRKVHEFKCDGQLISVISFDRFFSRNDEIDFVVTRRARDPFPESHESVTLIGKERATLARIKLIWPAERPPKQVSYVQTSAAGIRQAAVRRAITQEEGRPVSEIEIFEPEIGGRFQLEWDW